MLLRITVRTISIAVAALLVPLAGALFAQSKTLEGETRVLTGTVESIEASSRMLTLKLPKGEYKEVEVPEGVKKFSDIKIGDRVTVRYYDNVVLRLKKPGETEADTSGAAVTRSSEKTAGTAAHQRTITATITEIDPKTPSITFTGPNNWKYSSRVRDKKALSQVKVGDKVDITWTTAMVASIETAPAK
jgi:Cu/Ag efflux protein CusF